MSESLHKSALLLLGHGSTLNADSSAPTYQHAEEIRRRGIFAEVHVAFWKEEPNFRQALRQTNCTTVYAVPNFISSGYFTEQVIPRELGLSGPVTRLGHQDIFYCAPVGLDPSMTEALLRRAEQVVIASNEKIADPSKSACLFICGHGTSFNDNSTKIIHEQAAIIRARGLYADCQAVLMEQTPFVKDWRTLTDCPDVIVVPFFISDGLHSYEDIPVLLGLTHNIREKGFTNPHVEDHRRLWYATAIGTEAFIADVILAQVRQFQANHAGEVTRQNELGERVSPLEALSRFLAEKCGPWKIGEVFIRPGFDLCHLADAKADPVSLTRLETFEDLRKWILLDSAGGFRPLRAAPNLRPGWLYHASSAEDILLALDYLYPAAVANWSLTLQQELPVTAWKETAERQTGRFRIVREIDDSLIQELVSAHCQSGCLKRRLWVPAHQTLETRENEILLLCPEACNFLVGKAREKIKGSSEE